MRLAVLACLLTAALTAAVLNSSSHSQAAQGKLYALIITGRDEWPLPGTNETFPDGEPLRWDGWHLKEVLEEGGYGDPDPDESRVALLSGASNATKGNIDAWARAFKSLLGDDDVLLIVISSHAGGKKSDGFFKPDEPDAEVWNGKSGGWDESLSFKKSDGRTYIDDDLAPMFKAVPGTKVFIINACYSAGLGDDGTEDLDPTNEPNGAMLFSSKADQYSWPASGWGHQHSAFIGYIIEGLSAGTANATVRADTTDPRGEVTVQELFDYARPKTTTRTTQQPKALLGTKAGTVILRYSTSNAPIHPENEFTAATPTPTPAPTPTPTPTPAPTSTSTPTPTPAPPQDEEAPQPFCRDDEDSVGGSVDLVQGSTPPVQVAQDSAGLPYVPIAAASVAVALLAASGWYARRRWMR